MVTRLMLLKISLAGSLGAFVLTEIGAISIPLGLGFSLLLNAVLLTWKALSIAVAYVAGTVKPGPDASRAEKQFYRRSRLLFHLPVEDSETEGE